MSQDGIVGASVEQQEPVTSTKSDTVVPKSVEPARTSSYFAMSEADAAAQQAEVARRKRIRQQWMISVCIVMACLAFWFWRTRANHRHDVDPAELERQARENPNDFEAQLAWGKALIRLRQAEDAITVLDQANRLKPESPEPYAWKAVVAIAMHQEGEARNLFGEALKRAPSNPAALRGLANLDAQEHHIGAAIHGFEQLVKINPKDADAWQRLGLLLMGAKENYRSLDALTRSAALAPDDPITERALGYMALYAGKLDQSTKAFVIVLAHQPNDAQSRVGMADAMMRLDPSPAGLAAAEKQVDMAIQIAPTALAYYTRGEIRMTARHFDGAIADFNTSIRLDPQHRPTYVMLSQCYAMAGKPEMAKKISAQFERITAAKLAHDRALRVPSEAPK